MRTLARRRGGRVRLADDRPPTASAVRARLLPRPRQPRTPPAAARGACLCGTTGGGQVLVGGPHAGTIDTAEESGSRLPLMILVVVAMSMGLLIALVRSVTIALQAVVMNLLSIGAAYGVLVAVVQWGRLGTALGFPAAMPVTTWVPMVMFPVLFGLSMDYRVFLVSRVREKYERAGDTRTAAASGPARTVKVIAAAAAIMIAVFTTSLLGPEVAVKQGALGMAVAVPVDATVVRMIFVPAVMELCGKANWWMPGRRAPKTTSTAPAGIREEVDACPLLTPRSREAPGLLGRAPERRRRRPGSLTWAFVHERMTGTEPAPSAWGTPAPSLSRWCLTCENGL
ncbi:MMPL family transporter [Streptomyces sp. NPDC020472]|uniref:MMPL family transporter n=1 Tax=Streptomyces sp. NPDC020472 TaxID=3365075 RepID=UPI003792B3EE